MPYTQNGRRKSYMFKYVYRIQNITIFIILSVLQHICHSNGAVVSYIFIYYTSNNYVLLFLFFTYDVKIYLIELFSIVSHLVLYKKYNCHKHLTNKMFESNVHSHCNCYGQKHYQPYKANSCFSMPKYNPISTKFEFRSKHTSVCKISIG